MNGILSKAIAVRVAWRALHKPSMACSLAQSSKGRRRLSSHYGSRNHGAQRFILDHERHILKSNDRSTCCSFLESSTQSKHGVHISSKADIGYRRITAVVLGSWCTTIQIWPLMKLLGTVSFADFFR